MCQDPIRYIAVSSKSWKTIEEPGSSWFPLSRQETVPANKLVLWSLQWSGLLEKLCGVGLLPGCPHAGTSSEGSYTRLQILSLATSASIRFSLSEGENIYSLNASSSSGALETQEIVGTQATMGKGHLHLSMVNQGALRYSASGFRRVCWPSTSSAIWESP